MANFNISRLSEDVKREISVALRDIKDSRIANGLVSVSHCELTNDLSYCKVYISSLEGGEKTDDAVECLKTAAGFFKKRINQRIKMRKIPELIFLPDNSLDYYEHISDVISKLPKREDDTAEE
ncbi:MAG: 30S ribosome-binding factor RbfA [Ruminococcaceae bacterium]|nr:30S ribosome-binding factor RbfA [Oscillospiraceae bacterium]